MIRMLALWPVGLLTAFVTALALLQVFNTLGQSATIITPIVRRPIDPSSCTGTIDLGTTCLQPMFGGL